MSQTEKTFHFLDLDWTITLKWFRGRRTREWLSAITIETARRNDVSVMQFSPERAANLIRLLQQAIAQAYELERSMSEPATEEVVKT